MSSACRRRSNRRQILNIRGSGESDINSDEADASCIDLTEEDSEIIDLTNATISSPSLVPVLLPLSQSDVENERPARSRRRSLRNRRVDRSVEIIATPEPRPPRRFLSANSHRSPSLDNMSVLSIDSDVSHQPSGLSEYLCNIPIMTSPTPVKITCPICMDDDRQIKRTGLQLTSTVCGHIFCSKCIKQSIQTFHTCPTCRKPLRQSQIHPIFL